MAATATAAAPPFSLFLGCEIRNGDRKLPDSLTFEPNSIAIIRRGRKANQQGSWRVSAAAAVGDGEPKAAGKRRKRAPPRVDTRIHWENEDEGWIGCSSSSAAQLLKSETQPATLLGQKFADLLNESSNSHYRELKFADLSAIWFLGVAAKADLEEIKAAYRRLSKEYHPDTTSLPLKAASEKFMKLREVYDVLSNEETRRFYDWTLAQVAASRQAEKMRVNLKDPYVQDIENYKPVPDMVDRLGGTNMDLSDQAMSALTFDFIVIIFCICCMIYALFFKEY